MLGFFNKSTTAATGPNFAGQWFATYGPMHLEQASDRVQGRYGRDLENTIEGRVADGRLNFTFQEPDASGTGWFALVKSGRFEGQWRQDGQERWLSWSGERGFEGIWTSTFGLMRLMQEGERVVGFYDGLGDSSIEGQLQDGELVFRYQEPKAGGEGRFTLARDGGSFAGQWRQDGAASWQPWVGDRLAPTGKTCLVVIEAHWQRHLMDTEYSFGGMLKEFFARIPGVQFCHRFFSNEAGLRQWCRDLMFLPDPTVVVLASHGTAEGLGVQGQTVKPQAISESLQYASNVKLLHFSACLTMQDGPLRRELAKSLRFPISGYTTSVDWAASAIAEFTFLDMVLARGLSPADAAAQLPRLLSFAGDQGFEGSAYPSAGFRILLP